MTTTAQSFGTLSTGTVINFNRCTTADNTNYVVLRQYEDQFGSWTEVLNLDSLEKDCYMQHSKVEGSWSIVKEN